MKRSEIITAVIAMYGAVLATVTLVRQWKSDKVRVKLTVRRNREMINVPQYNGLTLVEIKITNFGHRPVTITSFGAIGLYPHRNLACIDSRPQLPCEIHEGQFISSYWDQSGIDFSTIDYWAAWDSRDCVHKLSEASRFKHWKSLYQQRREWKKTQIKTAK